MTCECRKGAIAPGCTRHDLQARIDGFAERLVVASTAGKCVKCGESDGRTRLGSWWCAACLRPLPMVNRP